MTSYDIGDQVRLSTIFTVEATGVATDPAVVGLVVRAADATSTTYAYPATITKDSTGHYHADIAATMAGIWRYRWTSTGSGAASEEGAFEVIPRLVS